MQGCSLAGETLFVMLFYLLLLSCAGLWVTLAKHTQRGSRRCSHVHLLRVLLRCCLEVLWAGLLRLVGYALGGCWSGGLEDTTPTRGPPV